MVTDPDDKRMVTATSNLESAELQFAETDKQVRGGVLRCVSAAWMQCRKHKLRSREKCLRCTAFDLYQTRSNITASMVARISQRRHARSRR